MDGNQRKEVPGVLLTMMKDGIIPSSSSCSVGLQVIFLCIAHSLPDTSLSFGVGKRLFMNSVECSEALRTAYGWSKRVVQTHDRFSCQNSFSQGDASVGSLAGASGCRLVLEPVKPFECKFSNDLQTNVWCEAGRTKWAHYVFFPSLRLTT